MDTISFMVSHIHCLFAYMVYTNAVSYTHLTLPTT